jgi:hypothetical protein
MLKAVKDGSVVNECLVLKKYEYPNFNFNQQNFKFLFAENLKIIHLNMFKESKLKYIYCPLV